MNNKELFLSAYMALKSIEKYEDLTHILVYTNKTSNADLVIRIIEIILKLDIIDIKKQNYYVKSLHSNNNAELNDIKLSNILYKQVGEYNYEFVFADLGLSTINVNKRCKNEDQNAFRHTINEFEINLPRM
jgi:hypothetical protein